jgi:hypothetical protein
VKKRCAFCDADAVEKGGEHIWDDWINKALPKKTLYRARKRYTLGSPLIEYDTASLSEKIPAVCEKCNSGWMSALTLKVKTVFSQAILEGDPFSLGARDAALLAAFTFMKAVVTNHCHDDEPFFTRAARERFRTSLVIPPLVKMWFAAYRGESVMSTKNNLSIISSSSPGPLYGMEFCSFTYVVGKLALQLLAVRWQNIHHRSRPLVTLSPNIAWEPAVTQFWPHDGPSLISWPPPKYLGDDSIQAFIQRFQMPVNIPVLVRES